jgi:transposase-like protein
MVSSYWLKKGDETMTQEVKPTISKLVEMDKDFLKTIVQEAMQQMLESEMIETLGAEKSERTGLRRGYRSGYYERNLVTRVHE